MDTIENIIKQVTLATCTHAAGGRISFTAQGFTVTCDNTEPALKKLLARLNKNKKKSQASPKKLGYTRTTGATPKKAVDNFLQDGEIENAVNLIAATKVKAYYGAAPNGKEPVILQDTAPFRDGYIIGCTRKTDQWAVTHLASGLRVVKTENKKDLHKAFDDIPPARLQAALDKVQDQPDFQQAALTTLKTLYIGQSA